jgi:HPt (histidine-containing phosphotransfer) domain-containing protein
MNNDKPIFDFDYFDDFTDGEEDLQQSMISIFIKRLNEDRLLLKKAYHDNNITDFNDALHKIGGASAHMGAFHLAEECHKAKNQLTENMVKQLNITCDMLIRKIQTYYKMP